MGSPGRQGSGAEGREWLAMFRAKDRQRINAAIRSSLPRDWEVIRELVVTAVRCHPRLFIGGDDLVQDVMLRCWQSRKACAAANDPAAFIAQVVIRRHRDRERRDAKQVLLRRDLILAPPEPRDAMSWPELLSFLVAQGLRGRGLVAFVLHDLCGLEARAACLESKQLGFPTEPSKLTQNCFAARRRLRTKSVRVWLEAHRLPRACDSAAVQCLAVALRPWGSAGST